jgi:hypothetical protein
MKNGNFFTKFNWRLLLLHFAATFFLMLGARELARVYDIDLFATIAKYGTDVSAFISHLHPYKDYTVGERIYLLIVWISVSGLVAALVAFVVSLTISIKNKISWLNSLLLLAIAIIINRNPIINSIPVKTIVGSIEWIFHPLGIRGVFIATGMIFIFISTFLFFSPSVKKIILRSQLVTDINSLS